MQHQPPPSSVADPPPPSASHQFHLTLALPPTRTASRHHTSGPRLALVPPRPFYPSARRAPSQGVPPFNGPNPFTPPPPPPPPQTQSCRETAHAVAWVRNCPVCSACKCCFRLLVELLTELCTCIPDLVKGKSRNHADLGFAARQPRGWDFYQTLRQLGNSLNLVRLVSGGSRLHRERRGAPRPAAREERARRFRVRRPRAGPRRDVIRVRGDALQSARQHRQTSPGAWISRGVCCHLTGMSGTWENLHARQELLG